MIVGSHNIVKFTVIKPSCQKHSECVLASGKMPSTHSKTSNFQQSASCILNNLQANEDFYAFSYNMKWLFYLKK